MAKKNKIAREVVLLMRLVLPEIEFYVPGEHDLLISILYQSGLLKEEDILWGDCQIIKGCKILIVFSPDGFISSGMGIEIDFERERNIPVFIVASAEELAAIRGMILEYLQKGND